LFENIFETVIKGSNTIFLDVNDDDYYLSYKTVNKKSAEEITNNYFSLKQKAGVPNIIDIYEDKFTHTVKITVEVDSPNNSKLRPFMVREQMNMNKNQ